MPASSLSGTIFLLQKTSINNETNYKRFEFFPLKTEINKRFHLRLTRLDDIQPFFDSCAAAKPFFF